MQKSTSNPENSKSKIKQIMLLQGSTVTFTPSPTTNRKVFQWKLKNIYTTF